MANATEMIFIHLFNCHQIQMHCSWAQLHRAFTFLELHLLGSKSKFCSARRDVTKHHKNVIVTFYSVLLLWECSKAVLLSFLSRFHVYDADLCATKVW